MYTYIYRFLLSYQLYIIHIVHIFCISEKTQITWIWLDKYRQQKLPQHPQLRLLNWTTGQGATYVTTHVWPLWQCGPFVRLLPWSRCKEDPPGSKTRRKLQDEAGWHVSYDMTSNDICRCKRCVAMRRLRPLIICIALVVGVRGRRMFLFAVVGKWCHVHWHNDIAEFKSVSARITSEGCSLLECPVVPSVCRWTC